MPYIDFSVYGQDLSREDHAVVSADVVNYLKARFVFSKEYDGLTKTVTFTAPATETQESVTDHRILVNDECDVPPAVIRSPYFSISVVAGDRLTTDIVSVPVAVSAVSLGEYPPELDQSLYDQLIAQFDEKLSSTTTQANLAQTESEKSKASADEAKQAVSGFTEYADQRKTELENIVISANDNFVQTADTKISEMENIKSDMLASSGEILFDMQSIKNNFSGEAENAIQEVQKIKEDIDKSALEVESDRSEVETNAQEAQNARDEVQQTYAAFVESLGKDVATLVGGKIPMSQIPATATQEIYEVEDESSLVGLVAQRGDLAELITYVDGEKTITKTWQLLGDGNPAVRDNWVVWGTSYAVSSGNAERASDAENAVKVGGKQWYYMTESEFGLSVKTPGIYAVRTDEVV